MVIRVAWALIVAGCGTPAPYVCDPERTCAEMQQCVASPAEPDDSTAYCADSARDCGCQYRYAESAGDLAGVCVGTVRMSSSIPSGANRIYLTNRAPLQTTFVDTAELDNEEPSSCGDDGADLYFEITTEMSVAKELLLVATATERHILSLAVAPGACAREMTTTVEQCGTSCTQSLAFFAAPLPTSEAYCAHLELGGGEGCVTLRAAYGPIARPLELDVTSTSTSCTDSPWFGRTCPDVITSTLPETFRLVSCDPFLSTTIAATGAYHVEELNIFAGSVCPMPGPTASFEHDVPPGVTLFAVYPTAGACDVSLTVSRRGPPPSP